MDMATAGGKKAVARRQVGDLRFYERQFPEKEELVMVKVERVVEAGAYVSLLEYNGIEGMILMSELSKQRIRSLNKIVRVGRHEVVLVLRVDKEKGYIDLSKKRVSPEDIAKCEERFSRSKKVQSIIGHISRKLDMPVDEINRLITWPLNKQFGHAIEALSNPSFSTTIVDQLELPPNVKSTLLEDLDVRLIAKSIRMRARIDVWCYGRNGVDAVREALLKGKEVTSQGNPDADVKVKLIASPQYIMITDCIDRNDGQRRLAAGVEAIEETIRKFKGGGARQQGEFLVIGGDAERKAESISMSESEESESESESEEESEEDEEEQEEGTAEQGS